jgi:hypothetical protein
LKRWADRVDRRHVAKSNGKKEDFEAGTSVKLLMREDKRKIDSGLTQAKIEFA